MHPRPPGWDAAWEDRLAGVAPGVPVRITAAHRGAFHATSGAESAMVELRGRHYRAASDKRDLPTVGDYCVVSGWDTAAAGGGSATIEALLPRRTLLVRRAAGTATAPQPLAANVDVALIVTAAGADLVLARLDRYLELVRDAGIAPMIVLSKCDLASDAPALIAALAERAAGVPVIATSVRDGTGLPAVRRAVAPGQTAVVLGSSGVGKSSLLAELIGASLPAAPVRAHDERGRHTTTVRQLFVGAGGELWIDTPGMRELAAYTDESDPAQAFAELTALARGCRFADCGHHAEPDCAVTAAVRDGRLPAGTLTSFHKLTAERKRDQARARLGGRKKLKPAT